MNQVNTPTKENESDPKKAVLEGTVVVTLVALDKPEPIKEYPKAKSARRLTNAKLKALAKKRQPPQSWYEEDLSGI